MTATDKYEMADTLRKAGYETAADAVLDTLTTDDILALVSGG